MKDQICPKILEKLEAAGEESCNCLSTYAGNGLFEVEHRNHQYVVDLRARTCGCRKWDMTGIPCAHAFSTILYDGGKPEDYVHPYYSRDMYILSYEPIIHPMPSEDQWIPTMYDPVEPPNVRVQPGRPKKLRIRQVDEPVNPYRVRKGGTRLRCKECRELGHNSRTCQKRKRAAMRFTGAAVGGAGFATATSELIALGVISDNVDATQSNASAVATQSNVDATQSMATGTTKVSLAVCF